MTTKKAVKKKAYPKKDTARKTAIHGDAVDEQLERYRSMRHFDITAEPAGSGTTPGESDNGAKRYPFVIQKHAASHLHYDFRLGWNGVLKSWAVAKGPSYVVADKRLAVQVEDHPMEYGGFEGIIPKGQYGGGTVMVWDQGWWEPQPAYPDVDAGLRDGSLKIIMHGTKMKGKWALIRMKGGRFGSDNKPGAKPNWLLIKEHDDFERTGKDPSITEAEPNSVVTGRDLDQIAANEDHVWNSKDTANPNGSAWFRQDEKSAAKPDAPSSRPASPGAKVVSSRESAKKPAPAISPPAKSPKEPLPNFISPQLATRPSHHPSNPAGSMN